MRIGREFLNLLVIWERKRASWVLGSVENKELRIKITSTLLREIQEMFTISARWTRLCFWMKWLQPLVKLSHALQVQYIDRHGGHICVINNEMAAKCLSWRPLMAAKTFVSQVNPMRLYSFALFLLIWPLVTREWKQAIDVNDRRVD